jgi:hypothetical protein
MILTRRITDGDCYVTLDGEPVYRVKRHPGGSWLIYQHGTRVQPYDFRTKRAAIQTARELILSERRS